MTEFKPVEGAKDPKEVSIEQLKLLGSPQIHSHTLVFNTRVKIYHIKSKHFIKKYL